MGNQLKRNEDVLSGRTGLSWSLGLVFFLAGLLGFLMARDLGSADWLPGSISVPDGGIPLSSILPWLWCRFLMLCGLMLAASSPLGGYYILALLIWEGGSLGLCLGLMQGCFGALTPFAALLLLGGSLLLWVPSLVLMCCRCWSLCRRSSCGRDGSSVRLFGAVLPCFIACSLLLLLCVVVLWAFGPYWIQAAIQLAN